MEKKEYIILPEFTTNESALEYFETSEIKFSFSVNGEIFSSDGVKINKPNNTNIVNINDLYIGVYDNPRSGELYIENDFLKYYKEN